MQDSLFTAAGYPILRILRRYKVHVAHATQRSPRPFFIQKCRHCRIFAVVVWFFFWWLGATAANWQELHRNHHFDCCRDRVRIRSMNLPPTDASAAAMWVTIHPKPLLPNVRVSCPKQRRPRPKPHARRRPATHCPFAVRSLNGCWARGAEHHVPDSGAQRPPRQIPLNPGSSPVPSTFLVQDTLGVGNPRVWPAKCRLSCQNGGRGGTQICQKWPTSQQQSQGHTNADHTATPTITSIRDPDIPGAAPSVHILAMHL